MSTTANAPLNLPVPLRVRASTGLAMPPLPLSEFAQPVADLPGASQRSLDSTHLGADYSVPDPNDLTQAGWGILFASDATDDFRAQLQPLIDHRSKAIPPALFRVFEGTANGGVTPGQTATDWAAIMGVSLTQPVNPKKGGVPFYLLLIGPPTSISFEFQAMLKMQWAVGRLCFDDIADYGRYVQAVLAYEDPANRPAQAKHAAVWLTHNQADAATAVLTNTLGPGLLSPDDPLGNASQFSLSSFANGKATKPQLAQILRGNLDPGPPAVILTGSHGSDYVSGDAAQAARQGALITQEWVNGTPTSNANQFAGTDVPADARLHGVIALLFACYSAGCPVLDSYYKNPDGTAITLTPTPFIAALPQALLRGGALAVIGHIDQAFPYSFQDVDGTPQPGVLREPLERLMSGWRAGLAADCLTRVWGSNSTQLDIEKAQPTPDPARIARLTIARDDARNYFLLGDPAVRLRVSELA